MFIVFWHNFQEGLFLSSQMRGLRVEKLLQDVHRRTRKNNRSLVSNLGIVIKLLFPNVTLHLIS